MKDIKYSKQIKLLILFLIVIVSGYILIRYVKLSYINNSYHDNSIGNFLSKKIADSAFVSGSSVISYNQENVNVKYSFPINIMDKGFALHEYLKSDRSYPVVANTSIVSTKEKVDTTYTRSKGIRFINVTKGYMSREYVLTNGAALIYNVTTEALDNNLTQNNIDMDDLTSQLPVGILEGDFYYEETEDKTIADDEAAEVMKNLGESAFTMEQLKDVNFLVRNFYIVDPTTKITDELFDAEILLGKDMTIKQDNSKPQILIYHTHSQEVFADSRNNNEADTVVGIGTLLADILREEYGYNVIHDKSCYDVVDGIVDRSKAYKYARIGVEKILKDNPTIEVIIDLHTDGMPKRSTDINGEEAAQIMLFNGLSRDQKGPITRLDNPNLQDNLSFSLQLQMKSRELYPNLFFKNYLKCWRYNLHLRPKSILIEWGTYKNTLKSVKNTLYPFAEILDSVLQGK